MIKRGLSSDDARKVRKVGHDAAKKFAMLIGMGEDYQNDKKAKKDVIDCSGDAHSVKSGKKKWQIFLYGRNRFIRDDGFQALNGIGTLLVHCIDVFPSSFDEYRKNTDEAKERLKTPMRELKDRLQRKALLRAFLEKSIFNGGEVDYLTVLDKKVYNVFYCKDVVSFLGNNFTVENSQVKAGGQYSEQKVLFKFKEKNVGELEMRNDSVKHYQEVRFNMIKDRVMDMLYQFIKDKNKYDEGVWLYGKAIRKFGNKPLMK